MKKRTFSKRTPPLLVPIPLTDWLGFLAFARAVVEQDVLSNWEDEPKDTEREGQ